MTALVRALEPAAPRAWVDVMAPAAELARTIAPTDFVPRALRNNPAAIAAAILYGDEVGLGPMTALALISVIDGRPFMAAEAQRGLVYAAGHDLWLDEATNARVTWCGRRRGTDPVTRLTWTIDDARKAQLDGKPNWKHYPRAMLSARSSAELVRAIFADVVHGIGALEEYDDAFDTALAPLAQATVAPAATATPAGPAGRRRRPRRPAPSTVTQVAPAVEAVQPPPGPLPPEPARPPVPPQERPPTGILPPLPHEVDEPPAPPVALVDTKPGPLSGAQKRKILAMFGEAGVKGAGSRRARLQLMSEWTGRVVPSGDDLDADEASTVIDALDAWAQERREAAAADTRDDEPPPDEPPDDVEAVDVDLPDDGRLL